MQRQISIAFQTNKTPADYIALAKLVNQYDFDAVTVYEDAPYHPSIGPLLLMAPHVERARLGPAGVSPARMAAIDMAANAALLAQTAPGGAYLGIVRGAWLTEHGIQEPDRPIQRIRESIAVVRYLLSGESGGYDGELLHVAPHVKAPYPLPEGNIPILIGTWGKKLAQVAGEIADELKIGGSANPDFLPLMREHVTTGERKAGRPEGALGMVIGAVTVADEDRDAARALARREAAMYFPVVARHDTTLHVESALRQRVQQHVHAGDLDSAAALISDDILDRIAISGNANDLIQHAERLFAAGASRVEFGTPHGLVPERGIRIIGEQVIPALRRS
jgi:5,10-methylenetetrahydromethanopterin reductase